MVFFIVGFVIGFAGGWAFFKHRASMKEAVKTEIHKVEDKL